ncbi:MAG: GNAT family N-acetyltransferase [Chloroflexota bacterium]|nr:GNAT family N-acetyltransferase [Chloroflexota bacterium]
MIHTFDVESFDSLASHQSAPENQLNWDCLFVLPSWLKAWWNQFTTGTKPYLLTARDDNFIIGMAPLHIKENTASFMGSTDVCDYQDFITVPGKEAIFFQVLLDHLKQEGIHSLILEHVRPESATMTHLMDIAQERGYKVLVQEDSSSSELVLPLTWDDYLSQLATKQRHEINRRLRRMHEAGDVVYRVLQNEEAYPEFETTFFRLFLDSREDKRTFMTPQMHEFFLAFSKAMSELGIFRLGILEINAVPVAATTCFVWNSTTYLYNSGYNPEYSDLSVGLMSKVLCIKWSIEIGHKMFDFLKGSEKYKYHLGGYRIPLYKCEIGIR